MGNAEYMGEEKGSSSHFKMLAFLSLLGLGLIQCSDDAYLTHKMSATSDPESDDVYQPGTPGGAWTDEEVATTRRRIFQMIHPDWDVKKDMYTNSLRTLRDQGPITENVLLRLAFHDCVRYADGSGGCNGCLNWNHMGAETPNPNKKTDFYRFDPINNTDNQGLDQIAAKLELIYTSVDWPFQAPSLAVSLHQTGKSRADLWQLAGLVALERALERANRACDLDFHARQQVTLLESREKCEIKITKPLKFLTGRADCVTDESPSYVTYKAETQPMMFGDSKHVIDFGETEFGMDAEHWTALQAIHGATHIAKIGLKYTWFGPGYISNMYFKMIANKPTYRFRNGGDLSFGQGVNIWETAQGDNDGNPVAQRGWRASCMYAWNTTEGGPCVLRPSGALAADSPNPDKITHSKCIKEIDSNGKCVPNTAYSWCKNVWCDENLVEHDAGYDRALAEVVGSWTEDASDKQNRHNTGWDNRFAFPYEIGLYWNFTVGGVAQRAVGCAGLDEPFGTITEPKWALRNKNSPIWNSPAMDCNVNTYAPQGKPMHEIVNELGSDNEVFAEKFLAAWQMMTSNGYSEGDLEDGPHSGWLGHYSLAQQGLDIPDFETYIAENAPVTFTDPTADPFICGHLGHFTSSCGVRYSTCLNMYKSGGKCVSRGEGPGL